MSMTFIQRVRLTSTQSEILFSSIPNTFTDLFVSLSLRGSRATVGDDIVYRFNGDTGSNYAWRVLLGTGSATSSAANGAANLNYLGICSASGSTSNTYGSQSIYIPNYTSSTAKSSTVDAVSEHNATESYQMIVANLWNGTAAINAIRIFSDTGNSFVSGSSATLYGITRGSNGGVTVS